MTSGYDGGAVIGGVVPGGPADRAGLSEDDTVTSIAGRAVSSPTALGWLVRAQKAGATVTVTYRDTAGRRHSVRVTLGSGPPQ